MEIGIRVPTVGPPQSTARFAQTVEAAGLDFMWMPDTPLLAGRWRDVHGHLVAAALATSRIRLGPGVTNPLTRHPATTASAMLTLDEASGGRADLAAGTGFSSAYIIGRRAATLASMRAATELWRRVFRGDATELGGLEIAVPDPRPDLPVYLAASGPKMLELAGEIADGVLIMLGAAPEFVAWALEHVDRGARRAGRDPGEVKRMLVLTACIDDDRGRALDQMRPCAASLYRHVSVRTLLARAGLEAPAAAVPIPRVYPDLGHALDWEEAKRATAFVPDAAVEAMVALGSPSEVIERVRALGDLGLDAIWWRDEASYTHPVTLLERLSRDVLPALRAR